jgi:hypothetical protein
LKKKPAFGYLNPAIDEVEVHQKHAKHGPPVNVQFDKASGKLKLVYENEGNQTWSGIVGGEQSPA